MSEVTNCVEKEKCCTTIVKNYYGCGGNIGCNGSDMDLSDYGKQVEFNVSGTTLQWRYSDETTWTNLFSIPQPSLVFSPHLWPVGTEVDLGDGSYGMRYTGTFSNAANTQLNINLNKPEGITSVIDWGGWWTCGTDKAMAGTPNHILSPISASTLWAALPAIISFRIYYNVAQTNVPYDVWIRYMK